jgi:short-subunit dehydrogenase
MLLEGKRVLVTGAGSGIGRALAIDASRRGAFICLCGRRVANLEETLGLLKGNRGHRIIAADITRAEDRERIADDLIARWAGLDILVNNAGVVSAGALETMDDGLVESIFLTNTIAPILLTRQLMPLLAAGRSPRVVNIGSVFGDIPFANFTAYSASKAGLKAFSTALRREFRAAGIAVTYAAPRGTDTDAAGVLDRKASAKKPKLDNPDRVAARIWDAVDLGKDTVYAAGPERFYILLQALLPKLIDRVLSPSGNQARRTESRQPPSKSEDIAHVQ